MENDKEVARVLGEAAASRVDQGEGSVTPPLMTSSISEGHYEEEQDLYEDEPDDQVCKLSYQQVQVGAGGKGPSNMERCSSQ